MDLALDILPSLDNLAEYNFNLDPDLLFQALINEITLTTNDFQKFFLKCQNSKIVNIKNQITVLNPATDLFLISTLEDELTSINEGKIKTFLSRQDSWEILNKE